MNKFFDFHSLDETIDWSEDWTEYCNGREEKKEKEWFPFLSFPVTKKCNFHCLYCGMGGEATASNNDYISIEQIKKYVSYAINRGLKKFRVTGGEPFLHPQIKEILQFLGGTGCYILVNTNGSLIIRNKELIETLPTNVKFAVSFDSLRSDILKKISGVSCHESIVEGIKLLKSHGNLLRLNMVYNRYNCEEVYQIIDFCQEIGCDLKILDVVSVPVPFNEERQDFYREVNSLERAFAQKSDEIYTHEYTRGFGTPCYRYLFGNVFVTVKNSKKGSHYDTQRENSLCKSCKYFPCHEGLYDIFSLSDGRLCACRWTEKQQFETMEEQLDWLIEIFKKATYVYTGDNKDMQTRTDLK